MEGVKGLRYITLAASLRDVLVSRRFIETKVKEVAVNVKSRNFLDDFPLPDPVPHLPGGVIAVSRRNQEQSCQEWTIVIGVAD
jgi:hypothetical protein